MPRDATDVRQMILDTGRRLSNDARDRILELNDKSVQPLIDIIEDRELWKMKAPGEGYAPVHAAELLGELHTPKAIAPLLSALADVEPADILTSTLIDALSDFGDDLVEAALDAIAGSSDDDYQLSVSFALAKCGAQDEQVYEHLLAMLERDPETGPQLLADYGDPRAIEHLMRAFDEFVIDDNATPMSNHAIIELKAAIKELGGTLTIEQRRKFHLATEPNRRFRDQLLGAARSRIAAAERGETPSKLEQDTLPSVPSGKLGRNEPCWCGSGKKYKKCHLLSDEGER